MKQKILLLHHRPPYPPESGMDKVRFNIIKCLSNIYSVQLLMFAGARDITEEQRKNIELYVDKIHIVKYAVDLSKYSRWINLVKMNPIPPEVKKYTKSLYNKMLEDIISREQFYFVSPLSDFMAGYIDMLHRYKQKIIFGPFDDKITKELELYKQRSPIKKKLYHFLVYRAYKLFFKRVCNLVEYSLLLSPQDYLSFQKHCKKESAIKLIKPIVELSDDIGEKTEVIPNSILFVGGMSASFNIEAAAYFMDFIFPNILDKIPKAEFHIVGNEPSIKFMASLKDRKGVIYHGSVPKIEPYLKRSAVYVSPILSGTGIKTKVIEALRYGKAIVSTSEGVRGLWKINDAIEISDDSINFAVSVIELLQNDSKRKNMEKSARNLYEQEYSVASLEKELDTIYKNL